MMLLRYVSTTHKYTMTTQHKKRGPILVRLLKESLRIRQVLPTARKFHQGWRRAGTPSAILGEQIGQE